MIKDWRIPTSAQFRSPCPGLNTLANHGLLPRSGRDVTLQMVYAAFAPLNFSFDIADFAFAGALRTLNKTAVNLNELNKHNVLEHDASLSRADIGLGGDGQTFNKDLFKGALAIYKEGGKYTSARTLGLARFRRVTESFKNNPKFTWTAQNSFISHGESALFSSLLGNLTTGAARVDFVKILFGMPSKLVTMLVEKLISPRD